MLVQIRALSVAYPLPNQLSLRAVDGVDLEIRAGEILGILGESGCGKSTLAKALLRLLPASAVIAGAILFRGRDLLQLREADLASIRGSAISLVQQDPALALNPVLTVTSQIEEVLRAHFRLGGRERRRKAMELLTEVGFDEPVEIGHAYPHQLSGGQRQRVVIAQAIACRPALVIADEPTSKLDAALQNEITNLLRTIQERHGTAVMMISHDPALLAGLADRIAVMYAGRIVELGSCSDVLGHPLHPYTQALVRIARSARSKGLGGQERFPAIEGEGADPTTGLPGCRFEGRCVDRMNVCVERYPQGFVPEPARTVHCFKYEV